MKKIFLFCASLIFLCSAQGVFAAEWTVRSSGVAQSFGGITESGDYLVAFGGGGRIYYSLDDGKTWNKSFEALNVTFLDFVTMPNGDLIATGTNGVNQISTNHGKTWSMYSFGITQNIYGIDVKTVSGSSTGYLVGSGGLYRNYVNGNWDTHSLGITTDLHGTEDRGDGTGWVVGADGKIFKLVTGGTSWVEISNSVRETLHAVRFVSSTKGFIVGTMGTVLKTVDGGMTWDSVSIPGLSTQKLYSLDVSGDNVVIAGDQILITSKDAGETWEVKNFEGNTMKFFGALITDAGKMIAVGSNDDSVSLVYEFVDAAPVVPPVVTEPTLPQGAASSGSLIKLPCSATASVNDPCKAVYFYGSDGKRHAFPNDKVFFSWYTDFSSVKEVSPAFLSSLPLGKNVTYRPGIRLVKFQTVPTVFAVSAKGTLRPIASEDVAARLYGATWNKQVDDIADVFYGNYTFGAAVNGAEEYVPAQESASAQSINTLF